jgi:predicted XRE-type DNA-binding protein
MNKLTKQNVIAEIQFWLEQSGLTPHEAMQLVSKYSTAVDEFVNAYLNTGSHLTPVNMADELRQFEEMNSLLQAHA